MNSQNGTYAIAIIGTDADSTTTQRGEISFNLNISPNEGPVKNVTILDQTRSANQGLNYTFPTPIFTEPEGETMTLSYIVNPSLSHITVTPDFLHLNVSSSTTNADIGTYTVTISATDGHSDTATATSTFNVIIVANQAPAVNETLPDLAFTETRSSTSTLSQYAFSDADLDPLTYTYSVTPAAAFLSYDLSTRVISLTPATTDKGNYTFTLTASDGHADTSDISQSVW